ncbi:hypothetical protein HS125_04560 [bacterium]|nr:hypothetical protein [bacterium]
MEISPLMQPMVQYGFAGFCAVLLALLFWMMRRVLLLFEQNTQVIERNTAAIHAVDERTVDELKLVRKLYDLMLSRPCIAQPKEE